MSGGGAKLTPYQRIVRAAKKGKGLYLNAEEALAMWKDDAIARLASNDDEDMRCAALAGATPEEGAKERERE